MKANDHTTNSQSIITVYPISNPYECIGYPSSMRIPAAKSKSQHKEVHFSFQQSVIDGVNSDSSGIQHSSLACSLIMYYHDDLTSDGSLQDATIHMNPRCKEKVPCNNMNATSGDSGDDNDPSRQLERLDTTKPVIILCHGLLSWRNQMLIVSLAHNLSMSVGVHTLRFDFTGSGHSSGTWKFANYKQDYHDLCSVVKFVEDHLQCRVICILGHSQGSAAVMRYASEHENEPDNDRDVSDHNNHVQIMRKCFVNLAGRYTVANDFDPQNVFTSEQLNQLKDRGMFCIERLGDIGKQDLVVTQEDVENRNRYDLSSVVANIRKSHVLTIHGDADTAVPVENAYRFDDVIRNHSLQIIEGATHNFNGLRFVNAIVSTIQSFITEAAVSL